MSLLRHPEFKPRFYKPYKLSHEELLVEADETEQLNAQIDNDLSEINRLRDVSVNLEDLSVIADTIETASDVEIALLQKAGDMAVVGTDIEPRDVVPGLEHFKTGSRLSTEDFKSKAKAIYRMVMEFIAKLYDNILRLGRLYLSSIKFQRGNVEHLLKLAGTATIEPGKLPVERGLRYLLVAKRPTEKWSDFERNPTVKVEQPENILDVYNNSLALNRTIDMVNRLYFKDVVTTSLEYETLVKSATAENLGEVRTKIDAVMQKFGSFFAKFDYDTEDMPGFAALRYKPESMTYQLDDLSGYVKDKIPTTIELLVEGDNKILVDLLISDKHILDTVISFWNTTESQIRATRRSIETALSKLESTVKQGDATAEQDFEAIANYSKTIVSWIKYPMTDLISLVNNSVRVHISIAKAILDENK